MLPDGAVVKRVEVFRRIYAALGLGWIFGSDQTSWTEAARRYRLPDIREESEKDRAAFRAGMRTNRCQ